jgi:hypothetical protein
MSSASQKDVVNMRRVPRRSFEATVGILTKGNYNLGQSFQLGEGGMMLASLHDLINDHHIVVSFQMGAEIVMVRAIVRGKLPAKAGAPIRYNVEFVDLEFQYKRAIRNYVAAATSQSEGLHPASTEY